MAMEWSADLVAAAKSAAKKLTGWKRRAFQAELAEQHCGGCPRRAEAAFGWGRETVRTGLGERRTGIRCRDDFQARGRKKVEAATPQLAADLHDLAAPNTQADPKLLTPFAYTRMTAEAARQALLATPRPYPVPARRQMSTILNRLGYRLRRVRKTLPKKKFPRRTRSSPTSTPPMPAAPPIRPA